MTKEKIKRGQILLADPFMDEPVFKRAAIYMCEHNKEGSLGFIINKQMEFGIQELVLDFPEFESKVYYGGPVSTDTIHYIHTKGDILENSIQIDKGIYWGGDFSKLKWFIEKELIKPSDVRFYLGYSGWEPAQLHTEIDTGSWLVADADINYIFAKRWSTLWNKILEDAGGTKAVISKLNNPHFKMN
jgi:putative transcriptional regulator